MENELLIAWAASAPPGYRVPTRRNFPRTTDHTGITAPFYPDPRGVLLLVIRAISSITSPSVPVVIFPSP
jgi:hypothetical protein